MPVYTVYFTDKLTPEAWDEILSSIQYDAKNKRLYYHYKIKPLYQQKQSNLQVKNVPLKSDTLDKREVSKLLSLEYEGNGIPQVVLFGIKDIETIGKFFLTNICFLNKDKQVVVMDISLSKYQSVEASEVAEAFREDIKEQVFDYSSLSQNSSQMTTPKRKRENGEDFGGDDKTRKRMFVEGEKVTPFAAWAKEVRDHIVSYPFNLKNETPQLGVLDGALESFAYTDPSNIVNVTVTLPSLAAEIGKYMNTLIDANIKVMTKAQLKKYDELRKKVQSMVEELTRLKSSISAVDRKKPCENRLQFYETLLEKLAKKPCSQLPKPDLNSVAHPATPEPGTARTKSFFGLRFR